MEYVNSPKVIALAGPPAAGKSTVASALCDSFDYYLLPLDRINSSVVSNLNIAVEDLRSPDPKIVGEFKSLFLAEIRGLRYKNIVLEGCRISHPHIFDAFRAALMNAYGEYVILRSFYLNPPVKQREQQYLLRQAQLAKEVAKTGDAQALKLLEQEMQKGFCPYLEPPLPGFEIVEDPSVILEYAQSSASALHPELPHAHMELVKAVAESGSFNPFYQRIEVDGTTVIAGFTSSEQSWKNILRFPINFSKKRVLDVGCMHGYYTFKSEEEGAAALGIDIAEGAICAARHVAKARESSAQFRVHDLMDGLDEQFDIVLALNVLHRVEDFTTVSRNIFSISTQVVAEVGEKQLRDLSLIAKEFAFSVKEVLPSHRCSDVVGQRCLVHLLQQ